MSETTMKTPVEAVYREMREDNSTSDSTTDRYLRGARNFLDWLDEQGIDPFEVVSRDFKRYMQGLVADGYAYGTLQPRLYGPRAFYKAAQDLRGEQQELKEAGRTLDEPEIPDVSDPTESHSLGDFTSDSRSKQSQGLDASDDHHKLTQEEVDQLAEHAPTPRLRNQCIIKLMYQCCLRRSELVRLKVSDVDLENRTIDVPAVKGNKGRDTPIPFHTSELEDLLSVWIRVERKGIAMAAQSEYLFPTERAEHITEDRVSTIIRTTAERAGLQETLYVDNMGRDKNKIHSHTLRASGAHRLWNNSGDIYFVAKVLGHKKQDGTPAIETTIRYLDADKEEIIEKARDAWSG